MISFWAYWEMFEEINLLAAGFGVKMTICVDDMTFTGAGAGRKMRYDVERLIKKYELRPHKRYHFKVGQTKVVTGVAITPKGLRLPNSRRKLLHQAHQSVDAEEDVARKVILAQKLLGRATEAEQIEPTFRGDVIRARETLNSARRAAIAAGYSINNGRVVRPHLR